MDDFQVIESVPLTLLQIIGRLHPASVHLPIGASLLLLLHEVASFCGLKGFKDTGPWFVFVTLMSFLPGVATGWIRAAEFESESLQQIFVHRNFMLLAFGIMLAATAPRLVTGRVTGWYLAGLTAALVILGYGADLGGQLVYGAGHLGG